MRNLFLALGFIAFFASCSNETDLFVKSETLSAVPFLNLQLMGYEDLAGVLSNVSSSEQEILLEDGSNIRTIHLKRTQKVNVEEGGHKIDLFTSQTKDFADAVLSPNYATLRFQQNGELISYVAYRDNEEMAKVVNHYTTQYLPSQNRSVDEFVTCIKDSENRYIDTDITCVKINITKAIECNPIKLSSDKDYGMNEGLITDPLNKISTYEDKPFPSKLFFMLVKEKNGGSLDHEITWQIESAVTSLGFLINSGFIEPSFIILDSPHVQNSNYPGQALYDFNRFLKTWDTVKGQGDRIYFCMRNGTWEDNSKILGEAIGLGLIHHFKPVSNFEIYALSTSSSLYPHTLAHEVGHLFGATHTFIKDDVMLSPHASTMTPHHKSADNWDRMLNCLIQR